MWHLPTAKTQNSICIRLVCLVFAVCMEKLRSLSIPRGADFGSDWADAQADLSQSLANIPQYLFCHGVAHLQKTSLNAGLHDDPHKTMYNAKTI